MESNVAEFAFLYELISLVKILARAYFPFFYKDLLVFSIVVNGQASRLCGGDIWPGSIRRFKDVKSCVGRYLKLSPSDELKDIT